jgi:hypothetical protein
MSAAVVTASHVASRTTLLEQFKGIRVLLRANVVVLGWTVFARVTQAYDRSQPRGAPSTVILMGVGRLWWGYITQALRETSGDFFGCSGIRGGGVLRRGNVRFGRKADRLLSGMRVSAEVPARDRCVCSDIYENGVTTVRIFQSLR